MQLQQASALARDDANAMRPTSFWASPASPGNRFLQITSCLHSTPGSLGLSLALLSWCATFHRQHEHASSTVSSPWRTASARGGTCLRFPDALAILARLVVSEETGPRCFHRTCRLVGPEGHHQRTITTHVPRRGSRIRLFACGSQLLISTTSKESPFGAFGKAGRDARLSECAHPFVALRVEQRPQSPTDSSPRDSLP